MKLIDNINYSKPEDTLLLIEEKITKMFLFIGLPTILIGTYRFFTYGFELFFIIQFLVGIILVLNHVLKNYLPKKYKAMFPIIVGYIFGILGIVNWGLLGQGFLVILSMSVLLAVLNNKKFFVIFNSLIVLILLFLMILIQTSQIVYKFDIEKYFYDSYSWIIAITTFAVAASILYYLLHILRKEWKNNYDALINSRYELNSILTNTPDIIYRLDLNGNITYINNSTITYGYNPEDLIGQPFVKFIHKDDIEKAIKVFKTHIGSKEPIRQKYEVRLKPNIEGTEYVLFQIDTTKISKRLKNNTEIFGIQGIARDISEMKKAQDENINLLKQLQQVQKMEALGTLAGGIAHDFNNILGGLFGYIQVMEIVHKNDEKTTKYLSEMMKASIRARDLVSQILAFSRSTQAEKKPTEIRLILKETIKLIKATIPSNIKIKENINNDVIYINANPTQIHQVIMNILTNAYHAIEPDNGVITISYFTEIIRDEDIKEIENIVPGNYLKLTISDDGCGMSEDTVFKIFDPYFTTKAKGKGTGLGLATVHGIIKEHRGFIDVDSKLGKGSEFKIYLPIIQNVANKESKNEIIEKGFSRILYVDDEPYITETNKEILESFGYSVISFTNSSKAYEYFTDNFNSLDILLTDLNMPDMSGIQLIKKCKEIRSELPVILTTGFMKKNMDIEDININKILIKPITASELTKAINEVLHTKKPL